MLRKLRLWLIKRLGGFTWHERLQERLDGWEAGRRAARESRSTRVNQAWRQMGEMANYLEQHHNAGFEIGFTQGAIAERRAHSCDQAYQDGFEDALDTYAALDVLLHHTIMNPEDFISTFKELRNG